MLEAAKRGDWDIALAMIRSKPTLVNARPGQRVWAAIHRAAAAGRVDVLRTLIDDFGADIQLPTGDGLSPLELAMRREQAAAASFLLEAMDRRDHHCHGAGGCERIECRRRRRQENPTEGSGDACDGESSDEYEDAVEGDAEAAAAIGTADIAARQGDWLRVFDLLGRCPAALAHAGDGASGQSSLLHQAARGGDLGIVRRLVEDFGAKPTVVDAGGFTAAEVAQYRGHVDVAAYLAPLTFP